MPTNQTAAMVNDIRDIKPPLAIPDSLAWLWWTLGAVVLLVALGLAPLFRSRRPRKPAASHPPARPGQTEAG